MAEDINIKSGRLINVDGNFVRAAINKEGHIELHFILEGGREACVTVKTVDTARALAGKLAKGALAMAGG